MHLRQVVADAIQHHHTTNNTFQPVAQADQADDEQTNCDYFTPHSPTSSPQSHGHQPSIDIPPPLIQVSAHPDTPSTRTGPPRSLSFAYSLPSSPSIPRHKPDGDFFPSLESAPDEVGIGASFSVTSDFRSALEIGNGSRERRAKKREGRLLEGSWVNPTRWLRESPREEKEVDLAVDGGEEATVPQQPSPAAPPPSDRRLTEADINATTTPARSHSLRRAFSVPGHSENKPSSSARWSRLRALLPQVVHPVPPPQPGPSVVASPSVNITDELITGGLSVLMLRLWFEHDDKGHRRIPILFHRLRIRISDSLHPMHDQKTVFRIECEYANGAARWVVYRTLRDFLSLHGHYTVANVYNWKTDNLPDFPKTSIPYLKFLKKELREKGKEVRQEDFARLQREALENYLIKLIRAVMFHPSTNRIAGFLEISALFIALAQSGGFQVKAGFLRIMSCPNGGGGFGKKSLGWKARKEPRWCAVRESYLVVLEEPGELTIWDVFLLDPDFKIERPRRYYRQRLHLLHHTDGERSQRNDFPQIRPDNSHIDADRRSISGSIKSCMSRIFHFSSHKNDDQAHMYPFNDDMDTGSSDSSSVHSRAQSPMLDPSTNVNPLDTTKEHQDGMRLSEATDVSKHVFYVTNSQLKLKLFAKNERQMLQWITSLQKAADKCLYAKRHRFDSFAPVRMEVAAQWLVDGRDYFWNLSRAMLLAKESIYIHDWWLSPELLLRRPGKERYRLDRLLERKAKEGVKIYIILYQEVSNRTTPIDSSYAKQRLTALHPNVLVQRSPSHFQTGTFYWAHHEKLCVIDQTIAFSGGLDLCFGRWDTPQHAMVDDGDGGTTEEIWPGKDYSNPRVSDFYNLNKPEESMYDRTKVPRMPWHDIAMQVIGEPARDLARHFVERWNYLLRIKNHSRTMPFLLPPPEFKSGELAQMGLTGTCEMQICRSAGPWSLGTPSTIEHSIQNAYVKAIELSEHFVYIENQFFITSTVVNDVQIENHIGDALVERIIRAHQKQTPWKCCVMIPLLPGFTFPVDHPDASAIRIILECQNRTISRGPHSIFSRLRKEGINPNDYISFFSLRKWAKMPYDVLTTEQVYIHAKVCVVDDRLAIIGSANINERSQRGDRDSELAAVIRDTDMIDGTMAGKPFKVGRFAHTLRVRLMREHLGVDVDALSEEHLMVHEPAKDMKTSDPTVLQMEQGLGGPKLGSPVRHGNIGLMLQDAENEVVQAGHAAAAASSSIAQKTLGRASGRQNSSQENVSDKNLREERSTYTHGGGKEPGFTSVVTQTLEEQVKTEEASVEGRSGRNMIDGLPYIDPAMSTPRRDDNQNSGLPNHLSGGFGHPNGRTRKVSEATLYGKDPEKDGHSRRSNSRRIQHSRSNTRWTVSVPKPDVNPYGFDDPIADSFWKGVWVASAVHNTEIFRKVFHAIPDDTITTWKQYKEFINWHERMNKPPYDSATTDPLARIPSEDECPADPDGSEHDSSEDGPRRSKDEATTQESPPNASSEANRSKKTKGPEPFERWEREEMERLLNELCGQLVIFPNRFLVDEDLANNFLYNADRLLPLPIYD